MRYLLLLLLLSFSFSLNIYADDNRTAKVKYVSLDQDTLYLDDSVTQASMRLLYLQASSTFGEFHLLINSPGGDMEAAEWFVNQMDILRARGKVINCYAGNYVASAAFFIYLHCDKRYALRSSRLFPHKIHISFDQAVLPSVLISVGMEGAIQQERWDTYAREVTGMTANDYQEFRDSDRAMWSIPKIQEKSTKEWFKVVDYYMLKVAK